MCFALERSNCISPPNAAGSIWWLDAYRKHKMKKTQKARMIIELRTRLSHEKSYISRKYLSPLTMASPG